MKNHIKNKYRIIFLLFLVGNTIAQDWQSTLVYYNSSNSLIYEYDDENNRIPDFSYAGYKNGNESIPFIPVVKTISPVDGDNTAHINLAILSASLNNTFDQNGFKGAVLLEAGIYEVNGILNLATSGIVLRGVGEENDPINNTIIKAIGNTPHQRSVLVVGGGELTSWNKQVANSKSFITSENIGVGERTFEIENPENYIVGDNIIIHHPCTDEWLNAINFGGTYSDHPNAEDEIDLPWAVNSQPLVFNRNIIAINENTITIDVPLFNHLDKRLSQSYIYKYDRSELKTNIGIEDIRIEIESNGDPESEEHAWTAFDLVQIEDAWIKNCTAIGFGLSGFRTSTATRVTIESCEAIDPVSVIDGGRRYNFNAYTASQQILFKDCYARNGRHHFMSNGMSWTSGIVFYDCKSSGAYASSEGHRRWSMGILWDNLVELDGPRDGVNPRLLGLYNRGYYGTSHGWSSAHSVAWNCDVNNGDLVVQKPPTAQNYAIGCFGKNIAGSAQSTFNEPEGFIEGSNKSGIFPQSLYVAQLSDRTNLTSLRNQSTENIMGQKVILNQNYPNPFNFSTSIGFVINKPDIYKLIIVNVLGEEIKVLKDEFMNKGIHNVSFEAQNLASGVYYYQLRSKDYSSTKKMIYLA